MRRRRRTGRALRIGLIALACALAAITLGFLAPLVIPLGLVTVLLVLVDPADLGSRLRHSPGWWGFPGLRRASRGAPSFAALLAAYTIVVPALALGGIVLVISTYRASPVAAAPGQGGGIGSFLPGTLIGTPGAPVEGSGPGSSLSARSGREPAAMASMAAVASAGATSPAAASATPIGASTGSASPTPAASPTASPTPAPTASPTPTATPSPSLCGAPANPWGYDLCQGDGDPLVYLTPPAPSASEFCAVFSCVADFSSGTGNVVECSSGYYALSTDATQQCGKKNRVALHT